MHLVLEWPCIRSYKPCPQSLPEVPAKQTTPGMRVHFTITVSGFMFLASPRTRCLVRQADFILAGEQLSGVLTHHSSHARQSCQHAPPMRMLLGISGRVRLDKKLTSSSCRHRSLPWKSLRKLPFGQVIGGPGLNPKTRVPGVVCLAGTFGRDCGHGL